MASFPARAVGDQAPVALPADLPAHLSASSVAGLDDGIVAATSSLAPSVVAPVEHVFQHASVVGELLESTPELLSVLARWARQRALESRIVVLALERLQHQPQRVFVQG